VSDIFFEKCQVISERRPVSLTRLIYIELLIYTPLIVLEMIKIITMRDRIWDIQMRIRGNNNTKNSSDIPPPYDPTATPIKKEIDKRKKSILGCSVCVAGFRFWCFSVFIRVRK
jgi:hypothetical protein